MATTYKVVAIQLVPADVTKPGGAQVTVVSYQKTGGDIRPIMLPTATPTLAQTLAAITADVNWRAQFVGQTVSV